jgi:hypothetical protein
MVHNQFPVSERIRRLLAQARRAEEEGQAGLADRFRRMADDLRPARVRRRAV